MGVDMNILIRPREPIPNYADSDLRVVQALADDVRVAFPDLDFRVWASEVATSAGLLDVIDIHTVWRYFGPQRTERGFWPQIREVLIWALGRFETYVGSDNSEEGMLLTAEYIRECGVLWNTERAPEDGEFVEVLEVAA